MSDEQEEKKAIKIIKSKKTVDSKSFLHRMHSMEVKTLDDQITIIRPDMLGCQVEGLAPYGSYAKIIVERKDNLVKVWNLVKDKPDPDYMIVNGVEIVK